MKHRIITLFFALLLTALLPAAAFADAIVYPDGIWGVDYYVYVATPDGGLNLRTGPGVYYELLTTVPDYVQLHITQESSAGWGYTDYMGFYGWVYLGQTTGSLLDFGDACNYTTYVSAPRGYTHLYIGPGESSASPTEIPDGTEITITREYRGWGLTRYDIFTGWILLEDTSTAPPTVPPTAAPAAKPTDDPLMKEHAAASPAVSAPPAADADSSPVITPSVSEAQATSGPSNTLLFIMLIVILIGILILLIVFIIYYVRRHTKR